MPITIENAVRAGAATANDKAQRARANPGAYFVSALLAGAYVGIAVVVLVSASAPFAAAGSAATKIVQGASFGLALTLVVFAGADLFTGNVMYAVMGLRAGVVCPSAVARFLTASFAGNFAGSLLLALAVHGTGIMRDRAGVSGPGTLLTNIVDAKSALAGPQLFWRAVLCNLLVCLALWMAGRAQTDGAKLAVLAWGLFAFIVAGFEHSIANMTIFSLAALQDSMAWGHLAWNLAWTVPGNIVGGALLVGASYSWLAPGSPSVEASS